METRLLRVRASPERLNRAVRYRPMYRLRNDRGQCTSRWVRNFKTLDSYGSGVRFAIRVAYCVAGKSRNQCTLTVKVDSRKVPRFIIPRHHLNSRDGFCRKTPVPVNEALIRRLKYGVHDCFVPI
jgi:hypothetical protein